MLNQITKIGIEQEVEIKFLSRIKCFARIFTRTVWHDGDGNYVKINGKRVSVFLIKNEHNNFWRGSISQ